MRYMPNEWTFSYKWFSRKEPRFSKSDWTFEKNDESLVPCFTTTKSSRIRLGLGAKQLEIEQNQNIYTPECRPWSQKIIKKTLAFYG